MNFNDNIFTAAFFTFSAILQLPESREQYSTLNSQNEDDG